MQQNTDENTNKGHLSPGMKQFLAVKNKYHDCLVLFRMGDFYETFYDDAKLASQVLGITLTKRGTTAPVPLAGIPFHALEQYLAKLVKNNIKVVIVEQIEDPKKAKGLVKRDVVRVVTPGTIIESSILNEKTNNYIAAINLIENNIVAVAYTDLSTGEFFTIEVEQEKALSEIIRINASEVIYPELIEKAILINEIRNRKLFTSSYSDREFLLQSAYKTICEHFNILSLQCFGIENKKGAISCSGALLRYLMQTQKTTLKHINKITYVSTQDFMILDETTINNLELVKNLRDGSTKTTLLECIDSTVTPLGSRLLKKWLLNPLLHAETINKRLKAVEALSKKNLILQDLRDLLSNIKDIERVIGRINYGNANARDLIGLKASLDNIPQIKILLEEFDEELLLVNYEESKINEIVKLISSAIKEDPLLSIREGNIIKRCYNQQLDELHTIRTNSKEYIAKLEEKERNKTGIKSLKIGFNNVFGYYIEITKLNAHLAPQEYIRKQTTANGERYITPELKEYEDKVLHAEEKIAILEYELFHEIIKDIIQKTTAVQQLCQIIAQLDIIQAFAYNAINNYYAKPVINDGFLLNLVESRHPVIEKIEPQFISNNIYMNVNERFFVITGPNMAGKSTVMRQVALITIMAQIGSFVPCKNAEISIVDRIFTRVGASDDLARRQSTFMVEMIETASIVNNATEKSLIIMDEIGRGTSTFDGVSIAWSVAEYINNKIKAKTLFATHYHVLTKLERFAGIKNYNIAVKEIDENIIFLHKLIEGGTDKSYGIHVAKLAGMPDSIIEKAREIQFKLEEDDSMKDKLIIERKITELKKEGRTVEEIEMIKVKQKTLFDI